ncbi:SPAPB1A10.06c, partial [Fragariocoptes setiger]
MARMDIKKKMEARKRAAEAIMSHKKKKHLEVVVRRKKLKTDRANLIQDLKQYTMKPEQLRLMSSTSGMQTLGLKKFTNIPKYEENQANSFERGRKIDIGEARLDAVSIYKRPKLRKRAKLDFQKPASCSSSETTPTSSRDSSPDRASKIVPETIVKEVPNTVPKIVEESIVETTKESASEPKPINKKSKKPCEKTVFVPVFRTPEVEKTRSELPIIGEESIIMDRIRHHDIVVVSGETGSGKTTQIPQFLHEAGFALNGKIIGITEPRRVAAVSMSQRVSTELNLNEGEVSFQIRFDGNVSDKTQIKFMTDGVLIKECQHDFLLTKYSAILIDEAHERSVFSDILIGLLSRIVPLRAKKGDRLKLIIMSATLRVQDFTENLQLFSKPPPVININSRQFSVAVHFKKTTPVDYIAEAFKKVCSIHRRLPKGGILVFVTSQKEIKVLCKKLRHKFPSGNNSTGEPGLHCLELYAMLPIERQRLVFESPPEHARLCVVATNVAETSITIPNIRYVVDTGKEKTKVYDCVTGVSQFITTWTSKASAEQRKGRAGRTCAGYCFRLYSSAVFVSDFPEFSEPQILRQPVDDLVLQMKTMNIDNVVNFPFPTSPSREALISAEKRLLLLGALTDGTRFKKHEEAEHFNFTSRPSDLGHAMAKFPVGVRYAKMIATAPLDILPYVVVIVSALSVRDLFLNDLPRSKVAQDAKKLSKISKKWADLKQKWSGQGQHRSLGDFMVLLKAVGAAEYARISARFCEKHGLRTRALLETHKLRCQLTNEINELIPEANLTVDRKMEPPSEAQAKLLRQLVLGAFPDHVAKRIPRLTIAPTKDTQKDDKHVDDSTQANSTKDQKVLKNAYECCELEQHVLISSESVLRNSKTEPPDYVVYKEIYDSGQRMYMRDLVAIEPEWLPIYASKMCTFSGPIEEGIGHENTKPRYNAARDQVTCYRSSSFGPMSWSINPVELPMVDCGLAPYRLFAVALLEGRVYNWFKRYTPKLLSPASVITKSWARLQPRTDKLIQALVARNVTTKQDLTTIWSTDRKYLLAEYLLWLPESTHVNVRSDWNSLMDQLTTV